MEHAEMTAHLTNEIPNGYNWLLVGIMFLVVGVISGLLPALLKWLWWYVLVPKAIYRYRALKYVALYRNEKKNVGYWKEKYLAALEEAEYLESEQSKQEEDTPYEKWKLSESKRWQEAATEQSTPEVLEYKIKRK